MDSYVKSVTVDVNAEDNYTMVKAKQGDKINRKIAITLKKDGANFTPSGVSQIWFRMEKPDGNIAIVKSTDSGSPISVSGNIYTVTLTEQCLTASGEAWCDLAFFDASGNILSSAAFVMKIIPMPNGDTAESTSEWTDLQKAIDDAERFADIVAFRTSGDYIQYTVDGQTWANLVNVGAIGGDLQTQITTIDNRFALATVSAANVNEFLLNVCDNFVALNIGRVCPVRYVWDGNDYYQGTMIVQGSNVFFALSGTNKTYYGRVNRDTRTVIVHDFEGNISAINTAIQKDNISSTIFYNTRSVVDDLNSVPFGSSGFSPSTANIPTQAGSKYGYVYYFQTNTWKWQIAITTYGEEFIRRNINNEGWSSWDKIVRESDLAYKQISITSSASEISSIYGYVENGVVVIKVELVAGLTSGWHNDIPTTLPSEYRPRHQIFGVMRRNASADFNIPMYGILHQGGNLQFALQAQNTGTVPIEFMYPLKTT